MITSATAVTAPEAKSSLRAVDVVRHARHDAAGGRAIEVADAKPLDVPEDGTAQVRHGSLTRELHDERLTEPRRELGHERATEVPDDVQQHDAAALHERCVDRELQEIWLKEGHAGGHRHERQRRAEEQEVWLDERHQTPEQNQIVRAPEVGLVVEACDHQAAPRRGRSGDACRRRAAHEPSSCSRRCRAESRA